MFAIFSGYRWSENMHGECWAETASEPRQSTAREDERECDFWCGWGRGRGREGIGVLGGGGLAPVFFRAAGRLAGARARPNAVVAIRVAAAHRDGRERRALFTSETLMATIQCSRPASFRHLERQC